MMVLGILGSPRAHGNSETVLEQALAGAASAGAKTDLLRITELRIAGCQACGFCESNDGCRVQDDMQIVYSRLRAADSIIVAAPVFFYGFPSQLKALIDRCHACYSRHQREKKPPRDRISRGRGYLIGVGARSCENLFVGVELTARYFFQSLNVSYAGALLLHGLEGPDAARRDESALRRAYEFGKASAQN